MKIAKILPSKNLLIKKYFFEFFVLEHLAHCGCVEIFQIKFTQVDELEVVTLVDHKLVERVGQKGQVDGRVNAAHPANTVAQFGQQGFQRRLVPFVEMARAAVHVNDHFRPENRTVRAYLSKN